MKKGEYELCKLISKEKYTGKLRTESRILRMSLKFMK